MSTSTFLQREDKFLSRAECLEHPWPKWTIEPDLWIRILPGLWKFWIIHEVYVYVAWFRMYRGVFPSRFLKLIGLKGHDCRRAVWEAWWSARLRARCEAAWGVLGLRGKKEKVCSSHTFPFPFCFPHFILVYQFSLLSSICSCWATNFPMTVTGDSLWLKLKCAGMSSRTSYLHSRERLRNGWKPIKFLWLLLFNLKITETYLNNEFWLYSTYKLLLAFLIKIDYKITWYERCVGLVISSLLACFFAGEANSDLLNTAYCNWVLKVSYVHCLGQSKLTEEHNVMRSCCPACPACSGKAGKCEQGPYAQGGETFTLCWIGISGGESCAPRWVKTRKKKFISENNKKEKLMVQKLCIKRRQIGRSHPIYFPLSGRIWWWFSILRCPALQFLMPNTLSQLMHEIYLWSSEFCVQNAESSDFVMVT